MRSKRRGSRRSNVRRGSRRSNVKRVSRRRNSRRRVYRRRNSRRRVSREGGMEAETAAEKEARWTKMAETEIAEWKQAARDAKSSGSSTAPLPGKPREVSGVRVAARERERDRERMGGARKSRSGTLSTKFVKNLLTPGTSEFAARGSRGGLDFSGKRIDASDGQPYDFASFQEIYGPQAEELWSIAEHHSSLLTGARSRTRKEKQKKGKKH
jgi:hypothetical protein